MWLTFGALGWQGTSRLGAASAVSAVAFWIEPVQRTLHLGEVDLLLMLLVIRDLANRGRRWQGAGLGVAAGIKLVALIFIPYLLITRQYRQAGVAAGAFAATVAAGALLFPRASVTWWPGTAFLNARRTGFAGYLANQSLFGQGGGSLVPWGLIWYAPATPYHLGDVPSHPEYHWTGLQFFAGNLYLLAGLVLLAAAIVAATGAKAPRAGRVSSRSQFR